jgi:hypothetical protein
MTFKLRRIHRLAGIAGLGLLVFSGALIAADQPKNSLQARAAAINFGGTEYVHRWSKGGQNEFTPQNDGDLARWRDMVTINVHGAVGNGDQLAGVANKVLSNYQTHGKIVRADSKPGTPERPAEHLIVALLGNPAFLEAAFARCVLIDGVGVVVVYSHRVYGKEAGEAMREWLKSNGPSLEKTLMTWDKMPSVAALKRLPQSK